MWFITALAMRNGGGSDDWLSADQTLRHSNTEVMDNQILTINRVVVDMSRLLAPLLINKVETLIPSQRQAKGVMEDDHTVKVRLYPLLAITQRLLPTIDPLLTKHSRRERCRIDPTQWPSCSS